MQTDEETSCRIKVRFCNEVKLSKAQLDSIPTGATPTGRLKYIGRGYPTRGFRSQLAFDQFVNRVIYVKDKGGWWDQIPMEDAAVMGPILAKTRRGGGSIEPGPQALSEQEYQLHIDKRIEAEMRGEKSPRSSSARRDTQPEESPMYVY